MAQYEIGNTPWYYDRRRWPGLVIAAFFGLKLLGCLSLTIVGRAVPAYPGMLKDRNPSDDRGPVFYVYHVNDEVFHGWRRGIQWGGDRFTAVYCPIMPWYHVTSLKGGLTSPRALLGEGDFWLRVFMLGLGVGFGALLAGFVTRLPGLMPKNWSLLPGLERDRPS